MKRIFTAVAPLVFSFALIASAQAQTTWNLTAGQTMDVGTVTVSNDATNLYVTYTLDDPVYPLATFGTLHVWAGNTLLNMPANNNGTPIPGQFCTADGGACVDATGLQTYTFTIPFTALNITDVTTVCGKPLYVVTHAEVDMDGDPLTIEHETAFGGPTAGGESRWWFYGAHTISCDFGDPLSCYKATAFAKGGYVWTTDKRSNPEKLPSLSLTKNRWGWAINLTAIGETTYYQIWAGAGLNNTSSGVQVGTLTVNWDGSNATVTYEMFDGSYLEEVHIYAADAQPTVFAPGQYGYPTEGYEVGGITSFEYTVSLADTNATGEVWLIAHAVVSNGACE
jgi:hypothetical protein